MSEGFIAESSVGQRLAPPTFGHQRAARPEVRHGLPSMDEVRAALRHQPGHGLVMPRDHDFLAAHHPVEQLPEPGLRLK